jgi:hypothetical protein
MDQPAIEMALQDVQQEMPAPGAQRVKARRTPVSRPVGSRSIRFEPTAAGETALLWIDTAAIELPLDAWDEVVALLAVQAAEAPKRAPRREQPRIPGAPPRTGASWSPDEDEKLVALFEMGKIPETIAFELQRTRGAVITRLENMGVVKRGVLRPDFAGAQRKWSQEQAFEDAWPPPR